MGPTVSKPQEERATRTCIGRQAGSSVRPSAGSPRRQVVRMLSAWPGKATCSRPDLENRHQARGNLRTGATVGATPSARADVIAEVKAIRNVVLETEATSNDLHEDART